MDKMNPRRGGKDGMGVLFFIYLFLLIQVYSFSFFRSFAPLLHVCSMDYHHNRK